MKVYTRNKTAIDLSQKDFISQGGEGKIFGKGNLVYKIHDDTAKMIPLPKLAELAVLTQPNIITPKDILFDSKNNPIGYTMDYVKDTHSLCQIFTKSFKTRFNIDQNVVLGLIERTQETIKYIHDHKILIVDCNEMNFLVSEKFDEVYFIDVNSYQTPSYPATAIMESIRDRHCLNNQFNTNTDWFAFGILAFQMLIGIHPYKGKHPTLGGLDERMKANVSVFNKDVSIPKVCYPLDSLPNNYKLWFKAIFEHGKRMPPPFGAQSFVVLTPVFKTLAGSNNFDIMEIQSYESDIIHYCRGSGNVITQNKIHTSRRIYDVPHSNVKLTANPKLITAGIDSGKVVLYDVENQQNIDFNSDCKGLMEFDGRFYAQNGSNIIEIQLTNISNRVIATSKVVGTALEQASQLFDGVLVQNLLGAYYASIFPASGQCYQVRLKELDDYRIVDAKYENQVLMLIGVDKKTGVYSRFVCRLSGDFQDHDVRIVPDVPFIGLNFTVLDTGVCVCLNEDEKVEVFSNKVNRNPVQIISDSAINSDIKLFNSGSQILFAKNNKLFRMSMKKAKP